LELYYLCNKDNRAYKKERRRFDARLVAFTYLSCLKKVYKKICLKELCLIKQGLYKLESKEKGSNLKDLETVLYSLVAGSLMAFRSSLANLFFNSSFSLLLDLISFNMP